MTPPTQYLQPLRGPVGLRELFFTRASSPMLGYIKLRKPWLLGFAVAALIAYFLYDPYPARSIRWPREMLLILQIFAWIGLELGCFVYGLRLGWCASRAQRSRRISQLALTTLRPVEIAQFLLARTVWPPIRSLAIVCAAVILFHIIAIRNHYYFIIGDLLIFINAGVTLYMLQWMQIATFLSAQSWPQAFRRQCMFYWSYLLLTASIAGIYFYLYLIFHEVLKIRSSEYITFELLLIPVVAPFWWVKFRLARAWAVHLERAIFHRIEI